jgi:NAD(P)H-hydrate epimerase
MRPVITAEESARLDAGSETPVGDLMERAGLGVALAAIRMGAGYGARVIILAGPGNNGGDGYVAARILKSRGADVVVRSLGYPKGDSSPNRVASIRAVQSGVAVADLGALEPGDLLIDALFGAGFHGSLPERAVPWTEHPAPVLAVDLPSGLDADDGSVAGAAFRATRTVTFHALKTGHLLGRGRDLSGEVEVVDIGLSGEQPEWMECEDGDAVLPIRPRHAHKWSAGSVAVVGGSPGMVGAAVIAGRAALEFGAGAVSVIVPGALQGQAAAMDPGLLTAGVGAGERHGESDAVLAAADRFDVMALGPGLGPDAEGFVAEILLRWDRPLVLDADATTAASVDDIAARNAPTVLTPHAGEFERLTGDSAGPRQAQALAQKTGAVVLLKGSPTFVMGEERWVVSSGGPELASIGTGDVLTGMVAAAIARGLGPEAAARAAAHLHGRAGAVLARVTTVTSTRLLAEIGRFGS